LQTFWFLFWRNIDLLIVHMMIDFFCCCYCLVVSCFLIGWVEMPIWFMPCIYFWAAKYLMSGVLVERCVRGKKLNESKEGRRQSVTTHNLEKNGRTVACDWERQNERPHLLLAQKTRFTFTILTTIFRAANDLV
jgi:hypothetical protein